MNRVQPNFLPNSHQISITILQKKKIIGDLWKNWRWQSFYHNGKLKDRAGTKRRNVEIVVEIVWVRREGGGCGFGGEARQTHQQ